MNRWLAVCLWLAPALVHADDVDVEVVARVLKGQDRPQVVTRINRSVASMSLVLTRDDGKKVQLGAGRMKQGATHTFPLDGSPRTSTYEGVLEVKFADGAVGSMPLRFTTQVVEPISLEVPYERMRLSEQTLELRMSHAADHCDVEVTPEDGEARKSTMTFSGEPPGTWLTVRWPAQDKDELLLKIRMYCFDPEGFSQGVDLFPWSLEVPHDDVVFATGSSAIDATEAPKLDKALVDIQTALRRYGQLIEVKLYVSGHTDTVGDPASNLALSRARAQAIARYFRKKGIKQPIFYTGHGEQRLAVPTADEVDEIRNRRARYIITVREPEPASWQVL